MTIDEAIELLQKRVRPCDLATDKRAYDALKLGIEALEAVKRARDQQAWADIYNLPGETEE